MTKNMGIGAIGNSDMRFIRKFRFTLKGKYLDEGFNNKVKVDYTNKELLVSIYEIYKSPEQLISAHVWADKLKSGEYEDEELYLTTYDGCGNEIYCKKFTGIKVINRTNEFDYSSSDVACHLVNLSFDSCTDYPISSQIHSTEKKETHVDHLNARMFIPEDVDYMKHFWYK